jgi:heme exporter protein A
MTVHARGVTKRFGPYTAVDDVSLTVEPGDSVAIHGPNGSGKTTLLRMLAGLSTPTEGTVYADGVDLYDRDQTRENPIGYVSHESMMYDDLTARENLRFHARLLDVDRDRVESVLDAVDLLDRADGLPAEFSHGMRKRLSLARSLLADPDVFLLDEPFTGLDQHSSRTLETIVDDRTVVLVTHDPATSADLCDRFLLMNEGRIGSRLEGTTLSADDVRGAYQEVLST